MKQKGQEGCAYCGATATTRDHVPPRGLFPKPWPSDFITVPSCDPCNGGASLDDEFFRVFLTLREESGVRSDAAAVLQTTMRGLHRPEYQGLRTTILSSLREVEHISPNGLYLGHIRQYSVERRRIERVCSRITRGLFYHHSGFRLPEDSW